MVLGFRNHGNHGVSQLGNHGVSQLDFDKNRNSKPQSQCIIGFINRLTA